MGECDFSSPYAFHGRRMIADKWVEWMEDNGDSELIYTEIGKPSSDLDKDWIKKFQNLMCIKNFIIRRLLLVRKHLRNWKYVSASIFMSFISSLDEAISDGKDLNNKKIGFISYGSGSKAKIFEGTIQNQWINKIKKIKLFQNLDSRKKISIDIYENYTEEKYPQI